jgi:hypothetical protein
MQNYLQEHGPTIFYGYSRAVDPTDQVYWDTERHPDFRQFVEAGRTAGAKLMVFVHDAFSLDEIDEALDQLEDSQIAWDEKHTFEKRIRELQAYEGFTCGLELSFDLEGKVYLFQLRTDWYQTLKDILAELEATTELEEDEDQGPMPGYFSKN